MGLFFPNRAVPGSAVTGGSWVSTLPASNVCTRELAVVARSTNALITSTKFVLDMGSSRALRAFALANVNFSAAATWRVGIGTTSGGTEAYSGAQALWTSVAFDSGLTVLGMEDTDYLRNGVHALIVLPAAYTGRYVLVEIVDTANTDGHVQAGRLFRVDLPFPSRLPEGVYEVKAYLLREGKIVAAVSRPLPVGKVGFSAQLAGWASHDGALYGLGAIIMALFAGWLGGAIMRRL